jgi:hypothetical protein
MSKGIEMKQAGIRAQVQSALALRPLAFRLLSSEPPADAERESLASASPDAWKLFLRAEACAIAISTAIRRSRMAESLPAAVREVLKSAEATETQRVLAARESLRRLDVIVQRVDAAAIVFKGGAVIAQPARRAIDLGDVDVLVPNASLRALWTALDGDGWRPSEVPGTRSIDDLLDREHLAALHPPGIGLPIELHRSVSYTIPPATADTTHAVPLPGFARLRRMDDLEYLVLLLRHSVAHHPHRRGHIRDLVMIADELAAHERTLTDTVRRALAGDPYQPELDVMLDQARRLADGEVVVDPPSVRPFVTWKYELAQASQSAMGRVRRDSLNLAALALERPPVRRTLLLGEIRGAVHRNRLDEAIRADRYGRWVPRAAVHAARFAYRALLAVAIVAAGPYLRRRVTRLGREAVESRPEHRDAKNRTAAPGIPLA